MPACAAGVCVNYEYELELSCKGKGEVERSMEIPGGVLIAIGIHPASRSTHALSIALSIALPNAL